MLRRLPFVDVHHVEHLRDDPETLRTSLAAAMEACDALLITGGVSKGDYDYVPGTLAELGAQLVFHGLPIRPGKPLLGAADNNGTLILGLPGNPVSATINAHRFAFPLLRRLGGSRRWLDQAATVTLEAPPRKAIPLHAMLLARHTGDGRASLVASKGSGDLVALSQSDGYVCLPPGEQSTGPWPMSDW
jgi:molybdenum cofactor synthesis domain-containing protein